MRRRLRTAQGDERLQLLWLAWASLLVPLTLVGCVVYGLIAGSTDPTVIEVAAIAMEGGITAAVAVAILRHRLLDIELVISRTLVYGPLSVLVILGYAAVVTLLGSFVHQRSVAGLFAAGAVAATVQPLRLRLQRRVDRLVYGDRADPYAAISRLGERLQASLASSDVAQTIVDSVAEALRVPYAAIEFEREADVEVAAAHGRRRQESIERVELAYQGETVGALAVAVPPGRPLTPADRRLLEDLAKQSAPAIRAVRLTADLQRSRERLVSTREEERRRLRRDLHDGLGPTLAAMVLELDAARTRVADEPDRADELLARLRSEAQNAIGDIRRVVYELRPPALDELGLVGAVREQAARLEGEHGPAITVDAPDRLPPLPAAVEVAGYRIATEALTNVCRHADARSCIVRMSVDDGLDLEVTDDGRGRNGAPAGVGLSSMRERAAELGGRLEVRDADRGGTQVRVTLPLGQ